MTGSDISLILSGSIIATYIWRFIGVLLSSRIDPDGAVFEWVGCVAYAMLAGLMARVMFYPVGLLEQTTFLSRAVALGPGFLVFFLSKRNFFAGTMAATTTFYLLIRFYEGF